MSAKDYLIGIRNTGLRVTAMAMRIDSLRDAACKISGISTDMRVQSDRSYSKVEAGAILLADMIAEVEQDIVDARTRQREAIYYIDQLKEDKYKSLLELRYIACLNWKVVADMMAYDEGWVHKMHVDALKELDEIDHQKHLKLLRHEKWIRKRDRRKAREAAAQESKID